MTTTEARAQAPRVKVQSRRYYFVPACRSPLETRSPPPSLPNITTAHKPDYGLLLPSLDRDLTMDPTFASILSRPSSRDLALETHLEVTPMLAGTSLPHLPVHRTVQRGTHGDGIRPEFPHSPPSFCCSPRGRSTIPVHPDVFLPWPGIVALPGAHATAQVEALAVNVVESATFAKAEFQMVARAENRTCFHARQQAIRPSLIYF